MGGCNSLEHIYEWLWVDVAVLNTFAVMCAFLEYFLGWVWVGVTVENTFMGGCTFLKDIYG